eukprot:5259354-Prymnesium_polylepis.1
MYGIFLARSLGRRSQNAVAEEVKYCKAYGNLFVSPHVRYSLKLNSVKTEVTWTWACLVSIRSTHLDVVFVFRMLQLPPRLPVRISATAA